MCSEPAPSKAIPTNSRAAIWRRASAKRARLWLEALWNAYTQDVTRARSMPSNALNQYIAEEPAALAAVNGDAAKLAFAARLVTALKSRRQVADDLKGLVGEDQDNHSFNAIGMSQYLAAARSKRVLKSKSDARVGIVVASGEIPTVINRRAPSAARSTADLLRQARYDTTVKAVVLRGRQPGRQHVRVGTNFARGAGAAQSGQTCRGLHEHLRGVGRLLYFRRGQSDFRESDDAHRFDRRVLGGADVPTHA